MTAGNKHRRAFAMLVASFVAAPLMLAAIAPAALRAAPTAGAEAAGTPQTGLRVVPLSIETAAGATLRYRVELAASDSEQMTGMMFRTRVPDKTGMLFPMNPPRSASFWMENTLVSLDILFIGSDGRIRNIAANAVPKSRATLDSLGPVAAVLELAGGEAGRAGIRPGDRVRWGRDVSAANGAANGAAGKAANGAAGKAASEGGGAPSRPLPVGGEMR